MKLKKIASLVLAGVMAMSMLAGCATTSVQPEPTPTPDEDDTQVSGYSQMLYNQLGYSARKKVTAQDDTNLNNALAVAMGFAAGNTIAGAYDDFMDGDTHVVNWDWTLLTLAPDSLQNGARALIDEMSAENNVTMTTAQTFGVLDPTPTNYDDDNRNISMLFVADGLKNKNAVMSEIAGMINREIELLEDDYDLTNNAGILNDSMNTDYEYTMSVAADTITLTADHGKSMTFVAVNIARI